MIPDTHIFLWWLFDDPRLSQRLRLALSDPGQRVLVSSASVWEIATKFRVGRLPEAAGVASNVPDWIIRAGFSPLPIKPAHAQLAGAWNHAHRDPFDRMLAAQGYASRHRQWRAEDLRHSNRKLSRNRLFGFQ